MKVIALLLAAVLLGTTVIGCGSKEPPASSAMPTLNQPAASSKLPMDDGKN